MEIEPVIPSRIVHAFRDGRWDLLAYSFWVRLNGLDLRAENEEQLQIDRARGNGHADSGGPDLIRVLETLKITFSDRILDLGSGKGGALLSIAKFPFAEILGVELSQRMIEIAQQNIRRVGAKNIRMLHADASLFDDFDRFNYVYMFNPFPEKIVNDVICHLGASLMRRPRKVTLIYKYPGCPDEFVDSSIFSKETQLQFAGSHPFSIYSSKNTLCLPGA